MFCLWNCAGVQIIIFIMRKIINWLVSKQCESDLIQCDMLLKPQLSLINARCYNSRNYHLSTHLKIRLRIQWWIISDFLAYVRSFPRLMSLGPRWCVWQRLSLKLPDALNPTVGRLCKVHCNINTLYCIHKQIVLRVPLPDRSKPPLWFHIQVTRYTGTESLNSMAELWPQMDGPSYCIRFNNQRLTMLTAPSCIWWMEYLLV